jgi:hypothetical protein
LWDTSAKLALVNLSIPLVTGCVFCLALINYNIIGFLVPATLVFYGMALVNVSRYTLEGIRSLGLIEIALGLINSFFIGYGILFWIVGFGLLHILYGLLMYNKYDRVWHILLMN